MFIQVMEELQLTLPMKKMKRTNTSRNPRRLKWPLPLCKSIVCVCVCVCVCAHLICSRSLSLLSLSPFVCLLHIDLSVAWHNVILPSRQRDCLSSLALLLFIFLSLFPSLLPSLPVSGSEAVKSERRTHTRALPLLVQCNSCLPPLSPPLSACRYFTLFCQCFISSSFHSSPSLSPDSAGCRRK